MTDKEKEQLEHFNQFLLERVRGRMQLTDLLNFLRFEAMAYVGMDIADGEDKDSNNK